jgi:acetyltransferase-like isoleucine patch superfamily enzyme
MFNEDTKSSFIKKLYFIFKTQLYYTFSFKKKFSSIKGKPYAWGIWNIVVYGPNISLGEKVLIAAADGYKTTLTTIKKGNHEGRITIGDNVLIMNGVRLSSASEIRIGDGCMLANFCYIMDADWHDVYDRTSSPGKTAPVILENGVWVGDSAIICKGVTIGENSIIGAGSVVAKNIPPNVIAAGNPVKVLKKLDPGKVRTACSKNI